MWPLLEDRIHIKAKDREERAKKATRNKKIKIWVMIGLVAAAAIGIGFAIATSKTHNVSALTIDGIQCNNVEQLIFHNHVHLDIFLNGQPYTIPSQIGIIPGKCFYWLHTHEDSGVVHIESPLARNYTLGQFFDIWKNTVSGNYPTFSSNTANDQTNATTIYVNGNKVNAGKDFKNINLNEHDEIAVAIGKPPNNIPSKYTFSQGT
jgi:hypothetical protein